MIDFFNKHIVNIHDFIIYDKNSGKYYDKNLYLINRMI